MRGFLHCSLFFLTCFVTGDDASRTDVSCFVVRLLRVIYANALAARMNKFERLVLGTDLGDDANVTNATASRSGEEYQIANLKVRLVLDILALSELTARTAQQVYVVLLVYETCEARTVEALCRTAASAIGNTYVLHGSLDNGLAIYIVLLCLCNGICHAEWQKRHCQS